MDPQRFDNLAKSLAGRLSRRNALRRARAAASATCSPLPASGCLPASAQDGDDQPVYTVIRRYTLDSPTSQVRAALQRGYRRCLQGSASSPTSPSRTRMATSRRSRSSAARRISRTSPTRRRTGSHGTWAISSPRRTSALRGYLRPRRTQHCSATPVRVRRSDRGTRSHDRARRPSRNGCADGGSRDPDAHSRGVHGQGASVRPGRGGHVTEDSSAARPPMSRVAWLCQTREVCYERVC